jgi:phosphoglycolate phosphatase
MIIIFDWDGTLSDSVEHIVAAMQSPAVALAIEPPAAQEVRNIIGLGLPQAVALLFPRLDGGERAVLAQTYSEHYVSSDRPSAALFAGAMDTLLSLRSWGFELAVATGKSRRGLDRVLAGLDMATFFDATRCADETRSKPHPLMLEEIMTERNKQPHEVLMVGDTEYDLLMAREAGVRSVGVSFGVHSRQRLVACDPVSIVDTLPQLLDLDLFAR